MSRRTELFGAALWACAGAAITVASWRMDRLSDRGINPWSAPGLTPGVVGALMVVLALVLALKALQRGAEIHPHCGPLPGKEGENVGGAKIHPHPNPLPGREREPGSGVPYGGEQNAEWLLRPGRERAGVRVESQPTPPASQPPDAWKNTSIALLLCLAYAGLSLGRGLHFAVASALFIFIFTAVFSWNIWRNERHLARSLAQTAAIAVLAAGGISWLFESVFLVRLP